MKLGRCLLLGCLLCLCALDGFSLDREAFTFTNYDLNIRIEPDQHRLGVRGKITLRNDSTTPQKIAILQISSSLDWRSITSGGKPVQFVTQPYTSDIDHTGMLSEAIVTLPSPIAPATSVQLEVGYEGVIVLDATRLTRIDTPESAAHGSDWDQISKNFTAVRGVGYVAWYPVATGDANLTEGTSFFEAVARWNARSAASTMRLHIEVPNVESTAAQSPGIGLPSGDQDAPELLVNATACPAAHQEGHQFVVDCTYRALGSVAPTFVVADYEVADRPDITVHFLKGHDAAATAYADAAEKVSRLLEPWFGAPRGKAQTADLPSPDAASFESGPFLLTALNSMDPKNDGLVAAHQLTHELFFSPRPWINEGLAHFAQVLYLEDQKGHQAALDYMGAHGFAFTATEKQSSAQPREEVSQSLINTSNEELLRSKAMYVWCMLRDIAGDAALKKALASYRPEQDKEPSYMPGLIQAQTQRDLEWFFDDWIYRDRGLPDFKVESAFTRKTLPEGYLITVTVDNLGAAGAEVPVTVIFAGGEIRKPVLVRGKDKGVLRIEVPKTPEEIVVNDGSVPESDLSNNTFKIHSSDAAQ